MGSSDVKSGILSVSSRRIHCRAISLLVILSHCVFVRDMLLLAVSTFALFADFLIPIRVNVGMCATI